MFDDLRKGFLILIAILGLGLGVVACDDSETDDAATTDTTTTDETTDTTTSDDGG